MYLSFYNLKHKPFQISTDPRFLWLGEKHEEALATLRYGVQDNKGFLLLTGDVGTGKTTLINSLLKTLGENTLVASIRDPALDSIDFFNYTAHAFGMDGNFTTKGSFLIAFERFLQDANSANKNVLLIIDEAQRIDQHLLEEVRLLSNIEKDECKLLNIFFVGQIEFNDILLRPENGAIRQRITINYTIDSLSIQETHQYIKHRLKVAAADDEIHSFMFLLDKWHHEDIDHNLDLSKLQEEVFTTEAINEIYAFSKGYPRLINIICDRSLLTGFVEESKTISLKHVKECAKELTIPQTSLKNHIVQHPTEEQKQNDIILPQADIPIDHNISKKQVNEKASSSGRNMKLAVVAFLLFLLFLSYFSVSENKIHSLQGPTITKFLQNLWQSSDKTMKFLQTSWRQSEKKGEAERHSTENTTVPSQPAPVLEKDTKLPTQEDTVTSISHPKDKVSSPEKNSVMVMSEPVSAPISTQEQNQVTEPIKETLSNNENNIFAIENSLSVPTENIDSTPMTNDSLLEKIIPDEPEVKTTKEQQVQPTAFDKKLIIPFPSNSNLPPITVLDKLNILVDLLATQPSYRITVSGYTDAVGDEAFNKKLSEFRANTVKSYLMGRGLEGSRITILGLGSQYPIAPNDTLSGRVLNRRVEIEIDQ